MGLDITAYRQLRTADGAIVDEDGYPVDDKQVKINPAYTAEPFRDRCADVVAGVYEYAETLGFRAGSYSGYNEWRRGLAALVGTTTEAVWSGMNGDSPFAELINFSDCEGVIGPKVSAKLAVDFAEWQAKADTHADAYWRGRYAEWRKAFEMGADGGVVEFH